MGPKSTVKKKEEGRVRAYFNDLWWQELGRTRVVDLCLKVAAQHTAQAIEIAESYAPFSVVDAKRWSANAANIFEDALFARLAQQAVPPAVSAGGEGRDAPRPEREPAVSAGGKGRDGPKPAAILQPGPQRRSPRGEPTAEPAKLQPLKRITELRERLAERQRKRAAERSPQPAPKARMAPAAEAAPAAERPPPSGSRAAAAGAAAERLAPAAERPSTTSKAAARPPRSAAVADARDPLPTPGQSSERRARLAFLRAEQGPLSLPTRRATSPSQSSPSQSSPEDSDYDLTSDSSIGV